MSAPSSRGLWKYADSKVLSTTKKILSCLWTISATAWISTTLRVGLVGVSIHTILVFGLIAASTLDGSVASTKEVSMFILAATCLKYLLVPPYRSSMETMWSPALRMWVIVVVAASPLEKVMACLALSREARQVSSTSLVGFPLLPYSYLYNKQKIIIILCLVLKLNPFKWKFRQILSSKSKCSMNW